MSGITRYNSINYARRVAACPVIDLYGSQCGILFIVSDVFGIFSNKWLVRETDREAQEIEKIRDTRGDLK